MILSVYTRSTILMASLMVMPALADDLTFIVPNTGPEGNVLAALYSTAEDYENGKAVQQMMVTPKDGKAVLVFSGIEAGTYGLTIMQDANGNMEMDFNLFGIPKEAYGFSSNPRIGMRAPTFDEFAFTYDGGEQTMSVNLIGG